MQKLCLTMLIYLCAAPVWATSWHWPLNGKVVNYGSLPAAVWDGEHGIYTLPEMTYSPKQLDVDHVYDFARSRWCKIGPHTVTIEQNGALNDCPQWVSGPGKGV